MQRAVLSWLLWIVVAFPTLLTMPQPASCEDSESKDSHHWAMLIGVEKYRLAPPLQYTINDVEQLTTTLRNRGGYRVKRMLETAGDEASQPLQKSILVKLPKWLELLGPDDTAIIYFTGHGFRAADGSLYLAPLDCDPKDPATTGIAVSWLRDQIGACKARFKLLVIDACHAGCEKAVDNVQSVSAKDIGEPFKQLSGVITLASSTGDEMSLVWDEKQQSLFSYWLNLGLKGHADHDADGAVTVDELYQYIFQNVPYVAEKRFSRPQTPSRIVGSQTPGVEVVLRPKPMTLKGTLADIAENLATTLQLRQVSAVGIPEFAVDAKKTELELGVNFGVLGRYCATELEGRLAEKSAEKFDVLQDEAIQKALHTKGIGLNELRTSATKGLSAGGQDIPAFALGILRSRAGREVTLQCELRGTERQNILTSAGGTALLNESEWAMLGRSVEVKPEDRLSDSPQHGPRVQPISTVLVARLDQKAQQPHPLADRTFPFRVRILVGDKERPAILHGNDWYVPLHKGEVYEIRAKNATNQPVFLRLLVDGLNTLPEKAHTKSITVEPTAKKPLYLPAQRVSLAEARAWKIEPGIECGVPGYFSKTGEHGKYNAFKVVDAPDSEASRKKFTDQIGLITAAFYTPYDPKNDATQSRSMIGTALGKEYNVQTNEYENDVPGELLAVVHIRYVEPESPETTPGQQQ